MHFHTIVPSLKQPVFATALATVRDPQPSFLRCEKGDLIQVEKDVGNGVMYGLNISRGSASGSILLRDIELNEQTTFLEQTQLSAEEVLSLKLELSEIVQRRESMQLEVAMLREAKEELRSVVDPVRFAVRTVEDLMLHLTQTDIGCTEISELMRESQNDWTAIVSDINRLQTSVDDPELDPFRRLVLDRCDTLKKRVAALISPSADTIVTCKLMHADLENLSNAFNGLPLVPRPSFQLTPSSLPGAEHTRSASQGSVIAPISPVKSPVVSRAHVFSVGGAPTYQSSASSRGGASAPKTIQPNFSASSSSLPDPWSHSSPSAPSPLFSSSTSLLAPDTPANTSPSSPPSSAGTQIGTGASNPDSVTRAQPYGEASSGKLTDRGGFLGNQRIRGASPTQASSPLPSAQPATSPTPPQSKFVLGTKPGFIKAHTLIEKP